VEGLLHVVEEGVDRRHGERVRTSPAIEAGLFTRSQVTYGSGYRRAVWRCGVVSLRTDRQNISTESPEPGSRDMTKPVSHIHMLRDACQTKTSPQSSEHRSCVPRRDFIECLQSALSYLNSSGPAAAAHPRPYLVRLPNEYREVLSSAPIVGTTLAKRLLADIEVVGCVHLGAVLYLEMQTQVHHWV
jgi:hypothetical protein